MAIGTKCERLYMERWRRACEDNWDNRPGVARLKYLQGKIRATAPNSNERQGLASQIEKLIREMKRTPAFVAETKRGFSKSAPRPMNAHAEICQAVAAEFNAKWERDDIGPRYARRCWDEYRRLDRLTEEEFDSGME